MTSVTGRVRVVDQPYGGYFPAKDFEEIVMSDGITLHTKESIPPHIMGLIIDYGARLNLYHTLNDANVLDVFSAALQGIRNLILYDPKNAVKYTTDFNNHIEDTKRLATDEDRALQAICRLCSYDQAFRRGPEYYDLNQNLDLDEPTLFNIKAMLERSRALFEAYGNKVYSGGYFLSDDKNAKAYEGKHIQTGDYDFLTETTLWDFNVSKYKPNKDKTLQLLVYGYMAQESKSSMFKNMEYVAVYNPRLNTTWRMKLSDVSKEFKQIVRKEVIGYKT